MPEELAWRDKAQRVDGFTALCATDLSVKANDVFVHRARISVRASDSSLGVAALHIIEAEIPRTLAALGRSIGDEYVALRRVAVQMGAWTDSASLSPISFERSFRTALETHIEEARRTCPHGSVSKNVAWFPTEAAAISGYLDSLANPGKNSWAFSVFEPLGSTWDAVLASCAERDLALAGDVLAQTLVRWGEDVLIREVRDAAALTKRWTSARGQMLDQLPVLTSRWPEAVHSSWSDAQAELVTLARLFVRWPGARALTINPRLLTTRSPAEDARALGESRAGGLVLWAELLSYTGLAREIANAYPNARARAALLWALGRALEDPSVSGRDPLLLLFCGEEPGRAIFPDLTLQETDSEPLRSLALSVFSREFGAPTVRVSVFGSGVVAVADPAIVIDWNATSSVDDTVQRVAERFIRWTGVAPTSIEVRDRVSAEDLNLIHAVDVPALPDVWRAPTMSIASLAMMLFRRQWRASPGECRGWHATVTSNGVALQARDVRRVANGTWLKRASVCMGDGEVSVSSK